MERVAAALAEILLRAIPTFILLWVFYAFAARVFFRPLQTTLRKRYEATGQLREQAETSIALAERKAAEYQEAFRAAWAEVARQQEEERQKALDRRAEVVRQARERAGQMVRTARQELQQEMETAKGQLAADSEQIAASILEAVLKPGLPGSARDRASAEVRG